MGEFPFQLLIDCAFPKKQSHTLVCTRLLRSISGKREVYEAMWNGRSVIIKLFPHKISGARHLKREWRGLSQMHKRQLSSPLPLFYGKTENGSRAVVMEKIDHCSTALEVFNEKTDPEEKLALLIMVCRELAKQHQKGVLQKDLHLGNFLISGDILFAIDPGQMRFLSRELTRRESISQLASLAACLPQGDAEAIDRLCEEYASTRGWRFGKSDKALFRKQLSTHKGKTVKKQLKKCLRTNSRCLKVTSDKNLAVFDRSFCQGTDPLDFIKQIDALMNEGQILKDGSTCYVSRLRWNGKDVVVKRYNHKGFVHSMRHTVKTSRARRGWLCGHRLRMLNIATPKPLAYIERRRGPIVWTSYLAAEHIEGKNLYNFLADDSVTEQQRRKVVEQIEKLLGRLGKYRIAHGDLKHSNILLTDKGVVLTDLDAMKFYSNKFTYKRRRAKDMSRFAVVAGPGKIV